MQCHDQRSSWWSERRDVDHGPPDELDDAGALANVRDPLSVCGTRHQAYFEPRPLYAVDAVVTDWQLPSPLDVDVSACSPEVAGAPSPALIIMRGEFDRYGAARIHQSLHDFAEFANHVVLDMSAVRVIDSGGSAFIETLQRAMVRRGGSLVIHDPSIVVEMVLQICGITETISACRPSSTSTAEGVVLRARST